MKQKDSYLIKGNSFKIILFGILFFMTACGGNKESRVRLSSNERALMDSLYIKQIEILRPMWDSICDSRFDAAVTAAVDSLIIIRIEEEVRLRARINKQQ